MVAKLSAVSAVPSHFRYQQNFHGVDLCSLRQAAMNEYFRQPIVDTFDIRICMSKSVRYTIDFQTANETDLHVIGELSFFPSTPTLIEEANGLLVQSPRYLYFFLWRFHLHLWN